MDNSQRLNELFNQARNQAPKTSFEETKQTFTTAVKGSSSSALLAKIKSFKSLLIMTLSTVILSIGFIYVNYTTTKVNDEVITKNETKTSIITLGNIEKIEPKTVQFSTQEKKSKEPILFKSKEITVDKKKVNVNQPTKKVNTALTNVVEEKYDFPVLTKKEIAENHKQKEKMVRGLARYNRMPARNNIDERIYPMVYWNKPIVVGKATSMDATNSFHVQSTEVSNLEYRTFLFDLLMKDKKEAFLKAKPNQELWLKEYPKGYEKEAQFMKDNYFSNPEYNDYPVVAISIEGAELYCEWLTEERNNLNPEKYGTLVNKVRLPTAKEWVQAAKGRVVNPTYSSGKELKNSEGCYLVNFMSGQNSTSSCIENDNKNAYAADGGFSTVKVSSYNPNGSGLFNMSGNVAEMVYYEDENNIAGAKGGSWMSTEEELKIEGEDAFKGKLTASIKVGFRPMIMYGYSGACNIADDAYRFPSLSPRQIEENNKIKANMLKELSKFDKKKYAFIPSGETKIKKEKVSVNAFYMQTTEVSVLEYRTFLYDLLIQGRKDDFLIAKPDQTQWLKYGEALKPMEVNYFSHPAYNDYPMNNVSKAGVELYCKWMNQEQTKLYGKTINDVRLPTTEEWMYAAKGGKDTNIYPWGIPDTKNSRGCYLANFKPGERTSDCGDSWNKLSNVSADSLSNYIQTGDDVILPKQSKDLYSADGGYYTVKVNSYSPNYFGLYNISGNVAEMVIANNGELVAKGGGWNSIGQQLQIEADNDFENARKPSVEIGFRVVITYIDDEQQSFAPFGTKKVSENLFMDETEISNFMWKEYLSWLEHKYGKESNEYLTAYPDTNVWSTYLNHDSPYDQHYFSHVAYKDYPVVGITYNQAVSFCNWRTDRVKEYYEVNEKSFFKAYKYRLPTKEEWESVANIGYSEKTLKELEAKHQNEPKNNYKRIEESNSNNAADVTAPVKSYWPNSFGIYNLEGNVAEMVQEKGIAKGGSWIDMIEDSAIKNDISYSKQECWLGFRCVFEVVE